MAQTDTYTASITNPQTSNLLSAQADISLINASTLHIVLTDTTAPGTTNRADLLGTVFLNVASGVTVSTAEGAGDVDAAMTSGHSVVNSSNGSIYSDQVIDGAWVFNRQTDADAAFKYGVSASGFSPGSGTASTTSDGVVVYGFSGFTKGDGGDDYMLTDSGTTAINGKSLPVAKYSVTIDLKNINVTNLNQITSVGFGFASGALTTYGYQVVKGTKTTNAVPEPMSLALIGTMLPIAALRRVRRAGKTAN